MRQIPTSERSLEVGDLNSILPVLPKNCLYAGKKLCKALYSVVFDTEFYC